MPRKKRGQELACQRCGGKWSGEIPEACPHCRSRTWWNPRTDEEQENHERELRELRIIVDMMEVIHTVVEQADHPNPDLNDWIVRRARQIQRYVMFGEPPMPEDPRP